jgi:hypothetical protein
MTQTVHKGELRMTTIILDDFEARGDSAEAERERELLAEAGY